MAEKKDKHKDKRSDLQKIKELIDVMKDNELVELEIKHGDEKIFLKRSQPQPPAVTALPMVAGAVPAMPISAEAAQNSATEAKPAAPQAEPQEELAEIKSPLVGTFYAAPSPDSEPYVDIGSPVTSQTVVCIVEAMKVMNEIKAGISGTITEILVKNGEAVEYGQVLFKVQPE